MQKFALLPCQMSVHNQSSQINHLTVCIYLKLWTVRKVWGYEINTIDYCHDNYLNKTYLYEVLD